MNRLRFLGLPIACLAFGLITTSRPAGQGPAASRIVFTSTSLTRGVADAAAQQALRSFNGNINGMMRSGDLRTTYAGADHVVSGRRHERLAQFHQGVRVFGGDVVRQTDTFGQPVSLFGSVYQNIPLDTHARVDAALAKKLLSAAAGGQAGAAAPVEMVVLPMADGSFRLTWTSRVFSSADASMHRVFVDANTGSEVMAYDDTWRRQAIAGVVGTAVGQAGDKLKIPAQVSGGAFLAVDLLRSSGANTTYDLKGSQSRANAILNALGGTLDSDIASDNDNVWSDHAAVASAHAYMGMTYDYYRSRFNRHSLDDHDIKMRVIVNPALPSPVPSSGSYADNAGYYGNGFVALGAGSFLGGVVFEKNYGGAIDIVAHELSHGVTQYTSNLIYLNESGALNESFSDMMGAAVEFAFQPLGTGPAKADWLHGEDVFPNGGENRSFSDPHSLGDPDHYSIRFIGTADGGGVHTNSSIVNHMYYLAVMGGTNRVSGLTVGGVGFANHEQVEAVIYRAFTQLLPSNATFSVARAAMIQASRDLFGAGSAVETAVTQAWTAVGVL